MKDALNRFYSSFENIEKFSSNELIELFLYFLTEELGYEAATAKQIEQCFADCSLPKPKNTASFLSKNVDRIFIKAEKGYKLIRNVRDRISLNLGTQKPIIQINLQLRKLQEKLKTPNDQDFLGEVIDCLEAGASRATIIMCWIFAIDHMYEYVFSKKLAEFNSALKTSPPNKKMTVVKTKEDFSELQESKFIHLMRTANIISNDVRKILDEKLGVRNSCAHASSVKVSQNKTISFIEDIVDNVILKYPI